MGRRISLHVDDDVLRRLMQATGEATPAKAVRKAIEEVVEQRRRKAIQELRETLGTIEFDEGWLEQMRREHQGAY